MKKFTTMLCAAVMAASMTFSAFAATSPSGDVVASTGVTMTVAGEQVVVTATTLTVSDSTDAAAVADVVDKAVAPVMGVANTLSDDPAVVAKAVDAVKELFTLAVKGATTEEFKAFKANCDIYEDRTTTEDGKLLVMNADGTEAEQIDGTVESVSDIFTLKKEDGDAVVLDEVYKFEVDAEKLGVKEGDTLVISVYTLVEDGENGISLVETLVKATIKDGKVCADLPANAIAAEVKKVV